MAGDAGDLRRRLETRPARRLALDGVDTHVLEVGAGPSVVLLHGGIESAGAYWAPVLPGLAAGHRLVVPDAPGLGESATLDEVTQPALEGWFRALLRATCPTPPVLVAHSLLGTFAARLAARNSGLLRRLVLCGTPGVGPYRMPAGLLLAAVLMGIRPSERGLMRFARWPFHDLARTRQRDPEWFDLFFAYTLACARTPRTQRTMRRLISLYTKQIPLTDLRAVTVPTTLLWGAHDRMVPVRVGRAAAESAGWPLRILPDAGHVPHLEDPAGFVATIEDIRDEVESGR